MKIYKQDKYTSHIFKYDTKNQIVEVEKPFLNIQRVIGMKIHINSLEFIKKMFSNIRISNGRDEIRKTYLK